MDNVINIAFIVLVAVIIFGISNRSLNAPKSVGLHKKIFSLGKEAGKKIGRIKKNISIGIGAVLLFLIITNPSMKQFKEFDNGRLHRRTANYIIFSIFETTSTWTDKYIGIALNFYKIDNGQESGY
jgi:hypothetical protein